MVQLRLLISLIASLACFLSPIDCLSQMRGLRSTIRGITTSRRKTPTTSRQTSISMSTKSILALDFDGVVCASSSESSFSSIVAAQRFWPDACGDIINRDLVLTTDSYAPLLSLKGSPFDRIRAAVNELRPIIETGYENMLIVRSLYETLQSSGTITAPAMQKIWSAAYRDQLLKDYGTNKDEMVSYFGKIRDDLIAENLKAWVALNPVYPSVHRTLASVWGKLDYTIITTKQERFVRAILETNGIIPPEKENIYDLENPFGPKVKVLQALMEKHQSDVDIHFVEDRFETLLAVLNTPGLERVHLYLVDWGYNTEEQRQEALRLAPRIKLINGDDFHTLVQPYFKK